MSLPRLSHLLLLLISLGAVSCSATYQASGHVTKRGSVQVTHGDHDSGDPKVQAALRSEIIQRGFTLTESPQSDFIALFRDTWRWQGMMYLSRLNLSLTDRRTGSVLADGSYRNSAVHTFPSAKTAVHGIFAKWDEQGTFSH